MKMNKLILTKGHCFEALESEILIGLDHAGDLRKKFMYHPVSSEFRVYVNDSLIVASQKPDKILLVYNDL